MKTKPLKIQLLCETFIPLPRPFIGTGHWFSETELTKEIAFAQGRYFNRFVNIEIEPTGQKSWEEGGPGNLRYVVQTWERV
mgnify:CR=1 FL=1